MDLTNLCLTILFIGYAIFTLAMGPRAIRFGLRAVWNRQIPDGPRIYHGHEGRAAVIVGVFFLFNGILWVGLGILALVERVGYFAALSAGR